jgi:hypothetical protein
MRLRGEAYTEQWDWFCGVVVNFSHESVAGSLMNPRDKAFAFVIMIVNGVGW